jgi:GT2 family glycosyltransferase
MASILVVNYNSYKIRNIVRECLKNMFALHYRPLEIIILDNASMDGSIDYIENLIREAAPEDINIRIVRLSKNFGFANANNIGFKLIDKMSRYVILMNIDLAPEAGSLRDLVDHLNNHDDSLAGVQGRILSWDGNFIDSCGGIIDKYGFRHSLGQFLRHDHYIPETFITYCDGSYAIYRREVLNKVGGLFFPYFFMWGDDYELGIRLWRHGYKLKYVPITAGRHYRSGIVKGYLRNPHLRYWIRKSDISVLLIYERYIYGILFKILLSLLESILRADKYKLRGIIDGMLLGWIIRKFNSKFSCRNGELRVNIKLSRLLRIWVKYIFKNSHHKEPYNELSSIITKKLSYIKLNK